MCSGKLGSGEACCGKVMTLIFFLNILGDFSHVGRGKDKVRRVWTRTFNRLPHTFAL